MRKSTAIALLFIGVYACSYGNTYTDNGADHLWNTSANWSAGVPVQGASNQWADMSVDGTICIIDSSHAGASAASAGGVYPGAYGGDSDLHMTGGELTCRYFNVGRGDSDTGGDGYFQMTGGVINAEHLQIPNQWASGSGNITGHVDLHGGVFNVSSIFSMGSRVSGAAGGGIGTMDITEGTLIIQGNYTSTIQDYIVDGWITAYGGAAGGQVNVDYDNLNPGKTTVTAEIIVLEMKAHNPSPVQDANDVNNTVSLRWSAGAEAVYHNIYLGTDEQAVLDANDPNALPGRGSSSSTSYYVPLDPGKTYYWRIDAVNPSHPGSPWKGDVWSFTTLDPLAGDVNYDWVVDLQDLREIAAQWLEDTCLLPDWCDGADLDKSATVDLQDYSIYSQNYGNSRVLEPPYTDYNAMLSQEIQCKKHGFMAGNLTYYIGGFMPVWNQNEDETIGLTHPFHHDLRSRGHGMANDPDTGYGHDLQGWEFYKDTKVAYGSVWIGGVKYTHPVPTAMYWRPDKMICEYSVAGVTITEEKFIAGNDAACTIITSSAPVTLEFEGQSFANNKTITTTATCQLDVANNAVRIVEGGTVEVKPTDTITTGVMMYDGMSTVISTSRPMTDYTQTQVNTIVSGQWTYSFKVPCDSSGVSLVWAMDDSYSVALSNVQDVLADPAGKMQAKSDEMNDILNYQIPYFRCSDQDIVDIYYYLWSLQMMYMIDVGQGWEQYPHTQTAVNNFLGMHRYDAVFQIQVGAWAADKERFANGNVLLWSALLPYAQGCGMLPDNMGTTWHSGIYGPSSIAHVPGAWQIYEHSGDLAFLSEAYAFYKPLFWDGVCSHWGAMFDAAECLAKMAIQLGYPEDAQHWYDLVNMDDIDNWLNARWDASQHIFLPSSPQGWTSMAYMGMTQFPDDWASEMTQYWAMDSVDGFFSQIPLCTRARKDWGTPQGADFNFFVTPDTNWYALRGMYMHHVGNNANVCTLGHLKGYNYNTEWGVPVAPETIDFDFELHGDQYSNFNAGKILLILEGILGLDYSVVDGTFTVSDHLPMEWDYMETYVPIHQNGQTQWTKVNVSRVDNTSDVEKTITVEGNSQSILNIEPWLEEKDLLSAPGGYVDQTPQGHISYQFDNVMDKTIQITLGN